MGIWGDRVILNTRVGFGGVNLVVCPLVGAFLISSHTVSFYAQLEQSKYLHIRICSAKQDSVSSDCHLKSEFIASWRAF